MIQDSNGIEIKRGDFVMAHFRVMDLIADSENLNLLVVHAEPQPGVPEEWRLELQSSKVVRLGEEETPAGMEAGSGKPAAPKAAAAAARKPAEEPEEDPAEEPHRGKRK